MDRSFLSDKEVIAASRQFVCIRLATYEDAAEAEVLKRIFTPRSGDLENTTFAILAPDGKTQHVRAGRSPMFAFGRDEEPAVAGMVKAMRRLAKRYARKRRGQDDVTLRLPTHRDLRLALNVASCDNRPLVIGFEPDAKKRGEVEDALRGVAWHTETIGRGEYVLVGDRKELAAIPELKEAEAGIFVVRPGTFGRTGTVLARVAPGARDLKGQVAAGFDAYRPHQKDPRGHIRDGRREGIDWKTAIPVTDPHAVETKDGGPGRRRRR